MEDRFESFTYLILKISKIIQKIKTLEMEKYGLRAIHVMCLYTLEKSQVGLTHKELVEKTLEDKGAISRALVTLKNKGLVEYDSNIYNSLIKLTKEGDEIAKHIYERSLIALHKGELAMDEEQRNNLYEALKAITNNVEDYYLELTKAK